MSSLNKWRAPLSRLEVESFHPFSTASHASLHSLASFVTAMTSTLNDPELLKPAGIFPV